MEATTATPEQAAAEASVDALPKPPSDVVIPPKDIRIILEKTAGYIVRNGQSFEQRIRERQGNTPKMSFLHPGDAYHPYYQWRLSEIREGRTSDLAMGRAGEADTKASAPSNAEMIKGPEPPPDFRFSARMPNISAQDLDVVRMTALFVAKNGRTFMTQLSQRESGNYQFDFLRPQHSLYQFFSRLVDQYTELLNSEGSSETARRAELQHNIKNKHHIMGRAKQRAEWIRHQEQQKAAKEEEAEKERVEFAQIDWHDFIVVETVVFDDTDDKSDLPPPTSLNDIQSASLEQKGAMSLAPSSHRIEEAMPDAEMDGMLSTDTTTYTAPNANGFANGYPNGYTNGNGTVYPANLPQRPPSNSMAPPYPPPQPFMPPPQAAYNPTAAGAMPMPPPPQSIGGVGVPLGAPTQAQPPAPVSTSPQPGAGPAAPPSSKNIRTNYVPRAAARNAAARVATSICPHCHQSIPLSEYDEHIRIELLDPRWKEQRAKAEARHATTNLSTADVANNLKRLASQRSDVFEGSGTGEDITPEERERRKRAAMSYDGHIPGREGHGPTGHREGYPTAGGTGGGQSIEEQLRHIRQKNEGQ